MFTFPATAEFNGGSFAYENYRNKTLHLKLKIFKKYNLSII